jgi:hypothetical protein
MNTKFYNEGDKSRAVCGKCKSIVSTTFRYGEYHIPGTSIIVPNLLQGYCDVCKAPVSIPHQSSYKIREHLVEEKSEKIEVRVPPQYTDILNLIGHSYLKTIKPNFLCRLLTTFYLEKLSEPKNREVNRKKFFAINSSLFRYKASERLSFPFPRHSFDLLADVSRISGKSKSDLVKSIIIQAKSDMLDNRNPSIAKDFQEKIPELV